MQTIKLIQGCPDPVFSPEDILVQYLGIHTGTILGVKPYTLISQLHFLEEESSITDYASYLKALKEQGYLIYNPFNTPEQLYVAQTLSKCFKKVLKEFQTKNSLVTEGLSLGFYSGDEWHDQLNLYFLPDDLEKETPLVFNYYAQQQLLGYTRKNLLGLVEDTYNEFLKLPTPPEIKTMRLQELREHFYKLLKEQFLKMINQEDNTSC